MYCGKPKAPVMEVAATNVIKSIALAVIVTPAKNPLKVTMKTL